MLKPSTITHITYRSDLASVTQLTRSHELISLHPIQIHQPAKDKVVFILKALMRLLSRKTEVWSEEAPFRIRLLIPSNIYEFIYTWIVHSTINREAIDRAWRLFFLLLNLRISVNKINLIFFLPLWPPSIGFGLLRNV